MKVVTLHWSHPNGLFGELTDLPLDEAEIIKKQMERDGCWVELL